MIIEAASTKTLACRGLLTSHARATTVPNLASKWKLFKDRWLRFRGGTKVKRRKMSCRASCMPDRRSLHDAAGNRLHFELTRRFWKSNDRSRCKLSSRRRRSNTGRRPQVFRDRPQGEYREKGMSTDEQDGPQHQDSERDRGDTTAVTLFANF